jgi:hypothetical protein
MQPISPNSKPDSPLVPVLPGSIQIRVYTLNIPSFKNSKMLTQRRLITKPENQRKMLAIIQSIKSQLLCFFQTHVGETLMVQPLRSWIVSSLPLDDSRQWVPELCVKGVDCDKGEEGCEIVIEPL